jgi:prepilin-type N-terminal cleavage/methylation domain-containing protein
MASSVQSRKAARRCRGTTLIELMVAIGIMSIIVTGAFLVMNEGLQLFRTNKRAADAQVSVLQVLTRVTTEAVNAKAELVRNYPSSGTEPAGIVFASPLDDAGNVKIDDETAELYWMKWICYYFIPGDPSRDVPGKLYRAEMPIPPDDPSDLAGSKDIEGVVVPGLEARKTSYFVSSSGVQRRLLGDDVSGFDVTPYEGTVGTAYGANAGIVSHDAYDIVVQAGDRDNRTSSGYFIEVTSRVTPRG